MFKPVILKTTVSDITLETKEENCYHNIKTTDTHHSLRYFMAACQGWFKLNPSKNYQDLEKYLRENNLNSHLYAGKLLPMVGISQKNTGLKLVGKDKDTEYKYECIYSCRPKEAAIKEVLHNWKTYEDNFEALKYTGATVFSELNKDKLVGQKVFSEHEMSDFELISNNLNKIMFEFVPTEDLIKELKAELKNKFKKDPEEVMLGMSDKGGPFFGFAIDGKIVSNIGFTMYHDKSGKLITEMIKISL